MPSCKKIKAIDFKEANKTQKSLLLDVRTDMERNEIRLKQLHEHEVLESLNVADFISKHQLDHENKLYILCRSGQRAEQAAQKFENVGYSNVIVIEGGINACREAGHAVEGYAISGSNNGSFIKRPISLERQVRIVAGSFIFIFSLLAMIVSPFFALGALGVGLGLTFAGLTDQCGLALILTKAPWNKTAKLSCCSLPQNKKQEKEICL